MHRLLPPIFFVISLLFLFSFSPKDLSQFKLFNLFNNSTNLLSFNPQVKTKPVSSDQPLGGTKSNITSPQNDQAKEETSDDVLAKSIEATESAVKKGTYTEKGEEKWIEVDLSEQKLTAWEGDKKVMEFLISSGKWGKTPTGTYYIWYKSRSQRMTGGSKEKGDFYDLPGVPFNMFFYGNYAVHGAYWHNNWGHPMSHGCVNTPIEPANALFEWTGPKVPTNVKFLKATPDNPGTKVVIHS